MSRASQSYQEIGHSSNVPFKLHKRPFLGIAAPPGYVAGKARGASGFMTRSDIGPTVKADKETDLSEENYSAEFGYKEQLFADSVYDKDDREADDIYDAVEDRMAERRTRQREEQERKVIEKFRRERPKLQQQLMDLKRDLGQVTEAEWGDLPDTLVKVKTKKQKREDTYTAVPDTVISSAMGLANNTSGTVEGDQTSTTEGSTTVSDLRNYGKARQSALDAKLSIASDSASGQTVVDPKGYLSQYDSVTPRSSSDVQSTKKGRLLLTNVIDTNPSYYPGWIAAAGLEEVAGKMSKARHLIMKGCEACPNSEEVWLEAARLLPPDKAKVALAKAVNKIPNSVKLWLCAVKMEQDVAKKRLVFRKALQAVPDSVKLWKAAVELESEGEAKVMLGHAVKWCPDSVDLWLALAHLETYENAQQVLNSARRACPADHQIWMAAAKLTEASGKLEAVEQVIQMGIKTLSKNGVDINRETWIGHAEEIEKTNCVVTAQAIIKCIISHGIEDEDQRPTWVNDAKSCEVHEAFACARTVHEQLAKSYPGDPEMWRTYAVFEEKHGTYDTQSRILERAVRHCPVEEELWLRRAKIMWVNGDLNKAREVLRDAALANENSQEIWLAAVKLESENNEVDKARSLLAEARQVPNAPRVWMKSAKLEWHQGCIDVAQRLLTEGILKYPKFDKLHLMAGQILAATGNVEGASTAYKNGLKHCKTSAALWILYGKLELTRGRREQARSIYNNARVRLPHNPLVWLEGIRLELSDATDVMKSKAGNLLALGLKQCANPGLLYGAKIFMGKAPKVRKQASHEAVKTCSDSAPVLLSISRLFWTERKFEKARHWFARSVKADADYGDAWAYWYAFELQHGTPAQQSSVVDAFQVDPPKHGEIWARASKDPERWNWAAADVLKHVAKGLKSEMSTDLL